MAPNENFDSVPNSNSKLEDFKRKHKDMEEELKRRLTMLKMKNLRLFLKQLE